MDKIQKSITNRYWIFDKPQIQLLRTLIEEKEWSGLSLEGPKHPYYLIMAGLFPNADDESAWWKGKWYPTIEHHYLTPNTNDEKIMLRIGVKQSSKDGEWGIRRGLANWVTLAQKGDSGVGDELAELANSRIEAENPRDNHVVEVERQRISRGMDILRQVEFTATR